MTRASTRRRPLLAAADGGPALLGRLALVASTATLVVAILALVATDAVRGDEDRAPARDSTTVRERPALPDGALVLERSDAIPSLRRERARTTSRRAERRRTPSAATRARARRTATPRATPPAAAPSPAAARTPAPAPAPPPAAAPAPPPAARPAPPAPRRQPAPQPAARPKPQAPPVLFDDQG